MPADPIAPPVARRIEHVEVRHGRRYVDPYRWLRDDARADPAVLAHLRAENAYTAAMTAATEPLRLRLYDEMVGRIRQTDASVPVRIDDRWYASRTETGLQYPIHVSSIGGPDAPQRTILDENALADGRSYFRLGALAPSPSHRLLAYSIDDDGSERFTLRLRDVATGADLPDRIEGLGHGVAWAADDRFLYYVTLDGAHRPHRVYRHEVGTHPAGDELVYEEPDESFHVGVGRTKDRRFVRIDIDSAVTSEVRWIDARDPAPPRLVAPRRQGIEYSVEHRDGRFWILTNDGAVNFRLVTADVGDPDPRCWRDVIAHDPAVRLEDFDVFRDHVVVVDRRDGLRGLRVRRLPGGADRRLEFPEPVYTVGLGDNPMFDAGALRFEYESLVTPETVIDEDLDTGRRVVRKRREVLGGYDPAAYRSERRFALAPDGARVPVSVVWRADARDGGPMPLVLYGYGAYGHTIEPGFSSERVSLLDRGVAFAIAHVRGGGALGRPWYEAGKLLDKPNTFTDFVAVAEDLVASGRTAPDRLAVSGGSAGGLLVGAVLNLRPDLFRAAVAKVPFVDVVNTMLDTTLPLTVVEWEEWGNPARPELHDCMASYSPYDNVREAAFPHVLATAGLHDPRVGYWEAAKWVARLREADTGGAVILLRTDLDSGHGGPSGRYDRLREIAFEYAFLLDRLGVSPRSAADAASDGGT